MASLTLIADVKLNHPIHRKIPDSLLDQVNEEDWTEFCDKYDAIVTTSILWLACIIAIGLTFFCGFFFISIVTAINCDTSLKIFMGFAVWTAIAVALNYSARCFPGRQMWLLNVMELCEQMTSKQASLTFRVRRVQIDGNYHHSVVVTTGEKPKTDYLAEDMNKLEKLIPVVKESCLIDRVMPEYLRNHMREKDWIEFCDKYDTAVTSHPNPWVDGLYCASTVVAIILFGWLFMFVFVVTTLNDEHWPFVFVYTVNFVLITSYLAVAIVVATPLEDFRRMWLERIKEVCERTSANHSSITFYLTSVADGEMSRYSVVVSIREAKIGTCDVEPVNAENDPEKMSLLEDKYDDLNEMNFITAIAV